MSQLGPSSNFCGTLVTATHKSENLINLIILEQNTIHFISFPFVLTVSDNPHYSTTIHDSNRNPHNKEKGTNLLRRSTVLRTLEQTSRRKEKSFTSTWGITASLVL